MNIRPSSPFCQCNILFSAQRYKLQLFSGFRRRVVVVFPSAEEWKRRLYEHRTKDGEQIPETALLKLQGQTGSDSASNRHFNMAACIHQLHQWVFF